MRRDNLVSVPIKSVIASAVEPPHTNTPHTRTNSAFFGAFSCSIEEDRSCPVK